MSFILMSEKDNELTELSQRIRQELPPDIEFSWDQTTGALHFLAAKDKKKIWSLGYGYPPYPKAEDAEFLVEHVKHISNRL